MFRFQKFIDKISPALLIKVFLVCLLFVVILIIFFYALADRLTERSLAEQMLHRQSVLVRSGAKSIEDFLKSQENEVLFLASLPDSADPLGSNVTLILKERLEHQFSPVVDIIRVDVKGEVVARGSQVPGVSNVADRDYFLWAKEKDSRGKVFYSQIAIARGGPAKGQKAFALATPIYQGERFSGLVAIVISVSELTKAYVFPLGVTENSVSLLILGDGTVITAAKDIPEEIRLVLEKIKKGEDGKASQAGSLVAFTPVKLAGGKVIWSLVTAVPRQEAFVFFGPFRLPQVGNLVFGLVSLIGLAVLFVFGIRITEREAYLKGFVEGRQKNKNAK